MQAKEEVQETCEQALNVDKGELAFAQPRAEPPQSRKLASSLSPLTNLLPLRLWVLGATLALECLAFAQLPRPWYKMALMPAPIAFGIALLLFGRAQLLESATSQTSAINKKFLALHALALCVTAFANVALLRSWFAGPNATQALIWIWAASLLTVVLSLVAALFPPSQWMLLVRRLRGAWAYAALATLAAMFARNLVQRSWNLPRSRFGAFGTYLQHHTFLGVKAILGIFYANVVTYPATNIVGTSRFAVRIEGGCSGIEGVVLMLALSVTWLIFMRTELKLTRAVWLVPLSLAAVWLLNLVRIATLISIGDAGHAAMAIHGFHTEAGWIFFNVIAIGFLLTAQHVSWFREDSAASLRLARPIVFSHSAEVIYLLPMLCIIAASMVSQLFSTGFEWLYPLRFFAALFVLWYFRAEYRALDWRFGWLGPSAGILVLAVWLWFSKLAGAATGGSAMIQQLAPLPLWQRSTWLAVRCAAMVVTAPIAEELAFRGYVARRVMAADFERVRFDRLSPIAIMISAVVFGLLHGQMWIASILAGLIFALTARLRGRLGDAIAAHVTVNLLLVIWGLTTGDYSTW